MFASETTLAIHTPNFVAVSDQGCSINVTFALANARPNLCHLP